MKFEKGDRVKDRYKRPKPGDESVTGTVISATDDDVLVKWDAPDSFGRTERNINPHCLEKIE
jgi:hypothetical protein